MNVNNVLVDRLATELLKRNARVATAESCTGGWISKVLTDKPGSSEWFEYGFVTYGDNAKRDLLNVASKLLEQHGAVSKEVAISMAQGAVSRSGARFSVAVTGIAGPDGGSAEKPVGTVWFAWAEQTAEPLTAMHVFQGDRDTVRRQALTTALSGLVELVERAG